MPRNPATNVHLDSSLPLLAGITNLWLPLKPIAGGHWYWDLWSGNHAALTNGPTWQNSPFGPGVETGVTAVNAYIDLNDIELSRTVSFFCSIRYRNDGSSSGANTETGIFYSAGHSVTSAGFSFRHQSSTLELLKSHIASIVTASVAMSNGEFHTVGFTVDGAGTATFTLYFDGNAVGTATSSTTFGGSGTTTLGYDADVSNPEYGRHTFLGAALWNGRTLTADDAMRWHLAAQQQFRPLMNRYPHRGAVTAPVAPVATYPPAALPRLPNFPQLWLPRLPRPIVFTPSAQQPVNVTPQVLPGPTRPTLPNFGGLWLRNLPVLTPPVVSPPSRNSVDVQKYPPPVHLTFPVVPFIGVTASVPSAEVPAPPPNPPPPPPPTPLPPPVGVFLPNFGQVWLAHLRETQPLPGPLPPTPPGPPSPTTTSKPLLMRVRDTQSESDKNRLGRITEILSSFWNYMVGLGVIQQTGLNSNPGAITWALRSGGFSAPRPPGPADDSTTGATPGCSWIDTTGQQGYICISNAVGSAVWKQVTV